MSGDIQTRQRRKEKRKPKRDEPTIGVDTTHITEMEKKNVQMHITTEEDHDVGWFAKIVFFILMAILAGLVVLIVMENRGGSDLDTPLSESRFSEYFEGFVDENREEDHLDEPHLNHDDDHDHEESFVSDALEDEKDSSNNNDNESEELIVEANMFESEAEPASPEVEDQVAETESESNFEDAQTFEEDSSPFEEEEDNEIELDFTGANDEGEDLLLKKLSEQAEQVFQQTEESKEDNDDEPESSHRLTQEQASSAEELLSQRRMTIVTPAEENLFDDEEIIEVMMISPVGGSKSLLESSDNYEEEELEEEEYLEEEEEDFPGSDDEYVPKTFEDFQTMFKSSFDEVVEKIESDVKPVDNEIEAKVELPKSTDSPEHSEEIEEEYSGEEELSQEEGSFEEDDIDLEEEEVEDENESETNLSEIDDEDLMVRLEAKYGKISGDMSSDDDPDYQSWTKISEGTGGAQSYLEEFEDSNTYQDNNLN